MSDKIRAGQTWGDWRLETDTMHLVLTRGSDAERYYIALRSITSSAPMLDWIFQLRMKSWVTNDIIGDLVSAFQDIFDPQGTLCGEGVDKQLNTSAHLARVIKG